MLGLADKDLKPFTEALLGSKDQLEDFEASLSELTRGIRAFFQFQDILDISIDKDTHILVNRHYAYCERLIYLHESIVSWLDRNVLAALTLLRPLLGLSLVHICWYLRPKESSYKPYYDWLELDKAKGRPRFLGALDYAFNSLAAKTLCQQNESEWLT